MKKHVVILSCNINMRFCRSIRKMAAMDRLARGTVTEKLLSIIVSMKDN